MVDLVNACFVAGGAVVVWSDVRRLVRDRRAAGVTTWGRWFYAAWVTWSVVMYASVGLEASVAVSLVGMMGHWTWVGLHAWYGRRP